MLIACMSDLHGYLPEPVECDLALVAGDIMPHGNFLTQYVFYAGRFLEWAKKWPRIAFIAGNHDTMFQGHIATAVRLPPRVIYLEGTSHQPFHPFMAHNKGFEKYSSLTVYGSPWSLPYGRSMAFMEDEEFIARRFESPEARYSNVWLSHGPPYGIGDEVLEGRHVGSVATRDAILKYKPKIVVTGHIHEGWGVHELGDTKVINASICDEMCFPSRSPIMIEI